MSNIIRRFINILKMVNINNAINHVTDDKPKIHGFISVIFAMGEAYLLAVLLYYVINNYGGSDSILVGDVFKHFHDLNWYLGLAYLVAGMLIGIFIEFFAIGPIMRPIRRAIAKRKGNNFDYAMTYIYDYDQFRFGNSDEFGWGSNETRLEKLFSIAVRLIMFPIFIQIMFVNSVRLLKNRLGFTNSKLTQVIVIQLSRAIFPKEEGRLLMAHKIMKLVKDTDVNYGKSRYYLALISERLGRWYFYNEGKVPLWSKVPKHLEDAFNFGVENAEFQLGMFYLQYANMLEDRHIDGNKEGVKLLQNMLSRPSSSVEICNMCRITIAKSLSDSDDVENLSYAISILDDINISNKATVKIERGNVFVRDCLKARKKKEDFAFVREVGRLIDNNMLSPDSVPLEKAFINIDYTSLNDIRTKLNLKLANAREIELIQATEAEKRKATENLMAMFAHKFRGPVDSIIFNTQHKHDERIYLDAARTMTGLLEVFSIVSTEPENLAEAMRNDIGGGGSPEKTILRSLKLALMQLLSQRNIKRMSRHYWHHARRSGLVPANVSFKDWATQPEMTLLEKEIQEKLEMAVSALSIDNGAMELAAWMQSNLFATTIEVADNSQIRFAEYGRKEALLITIMTEVLVNAIKHTDVNSSQPLCISWKEEGQMLVFECTNPSNRDSRSGASRGSGKGHLFLKSLLEKMQGEFKPDVYKELSAVYITMPSDLLKGATK